MKKSLSQTPIGVLPSEWRLCKLGEVIERIGRPVQVEDSRSYVQIGIRSHGKGIFHKDPVQGLELGAKSVFWIEPDRLVLNIVFAWEQAVARTTVKEIGTIGSHRFPMYRPKTDVSGTPLVDIDYVLAYLLTKRGTELLQESSPGGAGRNKTLGQELFLSHIIPVPPLSEQRHIVAILSSCDRVIELKRKLLERKKVQKSALMQTLFVMTRTRQGCTSHSKAHETLFRDCVAFLRNNTYSRAAMTSMDGVANIHYGDVLVKYGEILDFSVEEVPSLLPGTGLGGDELKDGDVIIADTAEDETCGKTVEISNLGSRQAVAGLHTIACRPKQGLFVPGWLGCYMNSISFHRQIVPLMAGIKVLSISRTALQGTTVSIHSLAEQRNAVSVLSAADREMNLLAREVDEWKEKKKALSQLLLSGKVRV